MHIAAAQEFHSASGAGIGAAIVTRPSLKQGDYALRLKLHSRMLIALLSYIFIVIVMTTWLPQFSSCVQSAVKSSTGLPVHFLS